MRFGDEDGLLWLPTPTQQREPGAKGSRGPRQARIHVPSGPPPESQWVPPTDFPRLHGVVSLDFETHDPGLSEVGSNWCRPGVGDVAGFALGWEDGERYYPIAHEGGGNVDRIQALKYLADLSRQSDIRFVYHNAPYDLGWQWGRLGFKPANTPYDTQAAVALLDEYRQRNNQGYNLNAVSADYLGRLKDETLLNHAARYFGLDPKKDLWKLHSKYVGPYAEGDASNTYDLWKVLEPLLRAEDLLGIFDLEMRYTVVVTAMRMRGVRVDTDRAVQFAETLREREAEAAKQLKALVGFEVPFAAPDAIEKAMKVRGIQYPRTATGRASFTAPWMKTIDDPLTKYILQGRRCQKVRGTFIEGFFIRLATNGRVYPQINPLPTDEAGTVSGRSSCTDPNLQQLSAKDPEMAREVRGICLPEEGAEWAALDYSQQEPRLAVHFAYLAGVPGALKIVQQYRKDPRTDFHDLVNNMAGGIGRPRAKILNLALIYGKGEAATCHELGFETEWINTRNGRREVAGPEGKAFLEKYHEAVPFVGGLKEACKRAVKKRGYIRTLLGRRCRFGEGKSRDHTAVNRLAQGSAADQLKKANVDMYEQLGEVPLVNVHDEIGMNKWSDAQIQLAVDVMVNTTPLEVPTIVDVATGADWGQAL